METPSEMIVKTVLETPIHEYLAIRLIDESDPAKGIEITVDDQHLNNVGVLHGGIFPSLLDVAAYLALVPQLAECTNATTVSNSTSIARGARQGDTIQFIGEVTKTGRTLAFVTASAIRNGETIATCELVKAIVAWPQASN